MSVKELRCPVCGAPISREKNVCDYCNTHYIIEGEKVLSLEYRECRLYKELMEWYRERYGEINEDECAERASFELDKRLKTCRYCHIKYCPFFGK
jgi:hypothetical protein